VRQASKRIPETAEKTVRDIPGLPRAPARSRVTSCGHSVDTQIAPESEVYELSAKSLKLLVGEVGLEPTKA
jgi:hypothetical protein